MYHLMISHSWNYSKHYDTVVSWIDEGIGEGNWKNFSISADDPYEGLSDEKLRKQITNHIARCGAILVLAGMYARYSGWIDYEIDEAIRLDKVIIGVKPWGQERIPKKIQDNATIMVGWNRKSVVNAIREYYGRKKTEADLKAKLDAEISPDWFHIKFF